ncbi:MAG: hypothetical protein AAB651_01035, partial [Patescibacteria group bacterium]
KRGRLGRGVQGGNAEPSERTQKEASPAALLGQSKAQQKSFLFLLEEKSGARKIKKAEKTFLLGGERQRAAAGRLPLSGSFSRSKKVRAKCIITAPNKTVQLIGLFCYFLKNLIKNF